VYALAAVVHWMITSKTPPPSVGRLFDDPYVPLAQSAAGRYSDAFLQAIDHALAVLPRSARRRSRRCAASCSAARCPRPQRRCRHRPRVQGCRTCRARSPRDRDRSATSDAADRCRRRACSRRASSGPAPRRAGEQDAARRRAAGLVVVARLAAFALWPKQTPPAPTTTATPTVATPARHAADALGRGGQRARADAGRGDRATGQPGRRAPAASPATATAARAQTLPSRDATRAVATPPSRSPRPIPSRRAQAPARDDTADRRSSARAGPGAARAEDRGQQRECARIFQLILARPGRPVGDGSIPHASLQISRPWPVQGLTASAALADHPRRPLLPSLPVADRDAHIAQWPLTEN
jgi:hypothetical protein